MLGFAETFLGFLASTFLPAAAGLLLVGFSPRLNPRYAAAFALGVFILYFSDTFADSAFLDLNSGLNGGSYQLVLLVLMGAGLLVFFVADSGLLGSESSYKSGLFVPLTIALAIGIHGFGEGSAFGSTAASTNQSSLVDAFGGVAPAVSFIIHKALEAVMVGACYLGFRADAGLRKGRRLLELVALAALFSVPGLVGSITGYYFVYDATYAFALAVGASLFVLIRLSKALFVHEGSAGAGESLKTGFLILLGFLFIYAAALLHS